MNERHLIACHFTRNSVKLRAHMILDDVRAGIEHSMEAIVWALRTLGEPVNP
jgi:hypothetical protein